MYGICSPVVLATGAGREWNEKEAPLGVGAPFQTGSAGDGLNRPLRSHRALSPGDLTLRSHLSIRIAAGRCTAVASDSRSSATPRSSAGGVVRHWPLGIQSDDCVLRASRPHQTDATVLAPRTTSPRGGRRTVQGCRVSVCSSGRPQGAVVFELEADFCACALVPLPLRGRPGPADDRGS